MSTSRSTRRRRRTPPMPTFREVRSHPAVSQYLLFCLAALFLLLVCLMDRGLEWWGLVAPLIGCLALLMHWSHGPPLVILSLFALLGLQRSPGGFGSSSWLRFQTPTLMDLVLCLAVLAYAAGHYRLLALTRRIFPADPRHTTEDGVDPAKRRSADLVSGTEMGLLALALPLWPGLAVMSWVWLTSDGPTLGLPRDIWRLLRVVWAVVATVTATGIVVGYLRLATASPQESLLYLQDELWRLTRREQGTLNRWLTWARLRAQRKKERL